MIATLLLLVTLTDIRAATQSHLQAMTTIRAKVSDRRVQRLSGATTADKHAQHGLYVDDYWWGLLRDSQRWLLTESPPSARPASLIIDKDGRYVVVQEWLWESRCIWSEPKRQLVPCHGELYTEGPHIRQIVQRVAGVIISVTYDWYELKARRLLPTTLTMTRGTQQLTIKWSEYEEWGASVQVKEWESDDDSGKGGIRIGNVPERGVLGNGTRSSVEGGQSSVSNVDDESRNERIAVVSDSQSSSDALVSKPHGTLTTQRLHRSWWQRLLRITK